MNPMGMMNEDLARREIEKLMNLLKIQRELKKEKPKNKLEEVILPFRRQVLRNEIRNILAYLRRWHVNLKVLIHKKKKD